MCAGPAWAGGAIAVICVSLSILYARAGVLPKFTPVAPVNPVPVITMLLQPAVLPSAGLRPVTVGGSTYVKRSAVLTGDPPSGVVTVTSTAPIGAAGATAVISLSLFT